MVLAAVHKTTGQKVATKVFERLNLEEDDELALQQEVDILSQLDHPNVVKLHEIYDEDDRIYLTLEIMAGGELFERIVEKEHYSEKEAAETLKPIVDAIRYCHSLGIVHRDLKPENLLYETSDAGSAIKITDFGMARFVQGELATTACGTPNYVAPEIIEGKGYGPEVDFWSIGIILYIMLCGFPPFYDDNNAVLFDMIKKGEFEFPSPYWDKVSDDAKNLVKQLLIVDPKDRLNAEQILNHTWMKSQIDVPMAGTQEKIKEFNARRKLKKGAYMVIAANRFQKLLKK